MASDCFPQVRISGLDSPSKGLFESSGNWNLRPINPNVTAAYCPQYERAMSLAAKKNCVQEEVQAVVRALEPIMNALEPNKGNLSDYGQATLRASAAYKCATR